MSHELDPWAEIAKDAPCPLLYQQTQGETGYCRRCLDCFTCDKMQNELHRHPPETQIWVCSTCAGYLVQVAKQQGVGNVLMGHYTEGRCGYPGCTRWSIVLQLVLGPINQLLDSRTSIH